MRSDRHGAWLRRRGNDLSGAIERRALPLGLDSCALFACRQTRLFAEAASAALEASFQLRRVEAHLANAERREPFRGVSFGDQLAAFPGKSEVSPERGEFFRLPFLFPVAPTPADPLAEGLARVLCNLPDLGFRHLQPHGDDGPPAPEGAVFRGPREEILGFVGGGGHGRPGLG
ncbi:MAG TPA: hypothetical protein VLM40_12080 [Gemmata sp.]|nr:hypothetical protein [Gemmata sp.]